MNIPTKHNLPILNIHGVALKIYGYGVLIIGKNGIGKSDLALNLINKGHPLIADDSILITKHGDKLKLNAPKENSGFIYIVGIGFINIATLYSKKLISKNVALNLIIELSETQTNEIYASIEQKIVQENILGINVHKFILPVNNNRPIPLLIEILIKNYTQFKKNAYNSSNEFIKKHQSCLL